MADALSCTVLNAPFFQFYPTMGWGGGWGSVPKPKTVSCIKWALMLILYKQMYSFRSYSVSVNNFNV